MWCACAVTDLSLHADRDRRCSLAASGLLNEITLAIQEIPLYTFSTGTPKLSGKNPAPQVRGGCRTIMEGMMANNTQKLNKKTRRELAKKKAKMRKIIIILSVVIVVIAAAAVVTISMIISAGTDTYTDGHQTVKLRSNGRFVAELHHDEKFRGTYSMEQQGNWPVIAFTTGGETVYGQFMEDNLLLPDAWHDDHGHNTVLPKK